MKKRINKMLMLIATLAISLTVLLVTILYYNLFKKQVMEDLKDSALVLSLSVETKEIETVKDLSNILETSGMRITLVDAEGRVLFDNEADETQMENHKERPEIREALKNGSGQAVRRSETLAESTFYYALRLDDGSVLRVAKDAGSILSVLGSAVPGMVAVLLILVALCVLAAHLFTKSLIAPVERMAENLDSNELSVEYEELRPVFDMIQMQHRDIMKGAKMRQEFTANVSHELKTPLTAISGYAELIETGMASEKDVERFAHGIHSSANRLLTLINDIIKLSELDSSEQEMVFEWVDLYQLADTSVEMLTVNAEKHNVSISLEGKADSQVFGNRQMLEELVYNLCDNAIRYNNAGGSVKVRVYSEKERVYLVVKDTGIGIPKEHQERIFERFYRVDKSRSKSTGGTGLGLAIVKHIVAKHEAKVELVSDAGKGTTITVIFEPKGV